MEIGVQGTTFSNESENDSINLKEMIELHRKEAAFKAELTNLINKYSVENKSNTPDFILADYLFECLKAYSFVTKRRDDWYGDRR